MPSANNADGILQELAVQTQLSTGGDCPNCMEDCARELDCRQLLDHQRMNAPWQKTQKTLGKWRICNISKRPDTSIIHQLMRWREVNKHARPTFKPAKWFTHGQFHSVVTLQRRTFNIYFHSSLLPLLYKRKHIYNFNRIAITTPDYIAADTRWPPLLMREPLLWGGCRSIKN